MQQTRWQRVALVAASEQHVSVASSMHLLARALYGRRFDLTSDYARNRQLRYVLTMASLRPIFELGTGRRLLDFGCGTGLFLELAEERGFECYGVDLSPDSIVEARARLRTAKTFVGPPTSIPQIAAGNFDVITMWSVLAHLPRPVDDLSMLRGLLAHDGVLVILTVNAASLLVGARGSAWSGFTKNHLMFYSRQTLPRLLAKAGFAGAGFAPFYGDEVEAGTSRLSAAEVDRLKRRVEATDGGNMLRAVGFATETAMKQWGQSRSPAAPRPMIKQAQPFAVNTGHLRTRPPDVEG
jgi:2-polyprenyl-3-methyl-5-hydroxy-6-metoxy-1,4-benzoquinol methylase